MRLGLAVLATVVSGCLYGLCFPTASLRCSRGSRSCRGCSPSGGPAPAARSRSGGSGRSPRRTRSATGSCNRSRRYYHQPLVVGVAFFFGVASLLAAPWYMAFALCVSRARARGSRAPRRSCCAAAAWVAARARPRPRGSPATRGRSSAIRRSDGTALVQVADLAGVYGVSFALVAVNAAVAEAIAARAAARAEPRVLAARSSTLGVLAYGEYASDDRRARRRDARASRSRMVQGNLDLGSQWREEFYGTQARHLSASHARGAARRAARPRALARERAHVLPRRRAAYRHAIAQVLAPAGASS